MNGLAAFLFSTGGVVVALLALAAWIWRRPASRAARRSLVAVATAYAVASTYVVPAAVTRSLTIGYHPFEARDVPRGTTAIVVLGAGALTVAGWQGQTLSVLNALGAARVLETSRVFRLIDPAVVISSGGLPDSGDSSEPSGIIMHDALVALGVPGARIRVESTSHDTHDEAVLIVPMLRDLKVDHVVLVTSDIHMRRAVGAFRAQGQDVIPAIAPDPRITLPALDRWRPTLHGLSLSAEVAHELLGIPYYWMRGWWRR
jgi:uncharacterized SAM-binding protein YcdF (DUF218 family)